MDKHYIYSVNGTVLKYAGLISELTTCIPDGDYNYEQIVAFDLYNLVQWEDTDDYYTAFPFPWNEESDSRSLRQHYIIRLDVLKNDVSCKLYSKQQILKMITSTYEVTHIDEVRVMKDLLTDEIIHGSLNDVPIGFYTPAALQLYDLFLVDENSAMSYPDYKTHFELRTSKNRSLQPYDEIKKHVINSPEYRFNIEYQRCGLTLLDRIYGMRYKIKGMDLSDEVPRNTNDISSYRLHIIVDADRIQLQPFHIKNELCRPDSREHVLKGTFRGWDFNVLYTWEAFQELCSYEVINTGRNGYVLRHYNYGDYKLAPETTMEVRQYQREELEDLYLLECDVDSRGTQYYAVGVIFGYVLKLNDCYDHFKHYDTLYRYELLQPYVRMAMPWNKRIL